MKQRTLPRDASHVIWAFVSEVPVEWIPAGDPFWRP